MISRKGLPEVKKLSNLDVKNFRKLPRVPEDRNIKNWNAMELRAALARHKTVLTFHIVPWILVYVEETKTWYRIDGNHTVELFSEVDLRQYLPIWVVYEKFTVTTMAEALHLYMQTNKASSSKKLRDYSKVLHSAGELSHIKESHYSRLIPAIALGERGNPNRGTNETVQDRATLLERPELWPFCEWWSDFVSKSVVGGLGNSMLLQQTVGAAAYRHWVKSPTKCKKFWEEVKKGNKNNTTPERKLHEFLKVVHLVNGTSKLNITGPIKLRGKQPPSGNNNIMVNACDQAWQAYLAGRGTVALVYNEEPFPTATVKR